MNTHVAMGEDRSPLSSPIASAIRRAGLAALLVLFFGGTATLACAGPEAEEHASPVAPTPASSRTNGEERAGREEPTPIPVTASVTGTPTAAPRSEEGTADEEAVSTPAPADVTAKPEPTRPAPASGTPTPPTPPPTLTPVPTPTPAPQPLDAEVIVRDNFFLPASVIVARGGTVTWIFAGEVAHDVTAEGFASGLRAEGSFRWTFPAPGIFDYQCTVHPRMIGRVTVR